MLVHRITADDRKRTVAFLRSRDDLKVVEVVLANGALYPSYDGQRSSFFWTLTDDTLATARHGCRLPWVLSAAVALHVVRTSKRFDYVRDNVAAQQLLRDALNLIDLVPDEPPTEDRTAWYMEVTRGHSRHAQRVVAQCTTPVLSFTTVDAEDPVGPDETVSWSLDDLQYLAVRFLKNEREHGPRFGSEQLTGINFRSRTVTGPKMSPIEWAISQSPKPEPSQ